MPNGILPAGRILFPPVCRVYALAQCLFRRRLTARRQPVCLARVPVLIRILIESAAVNRFAFLAILFAGAAVEAQSPVALTSEPHHRLILENSYVRVFSLQVPPHESTLLHQHDHDYFSVVLGDAEVTTSTPGQPEVHAKLKDAELRFSRGGFAHLVTNESDEPFRNVTMELLRPQTSPRNLCEKVLPNEPENCIVTIGTPITQGHGFWILPKIETQQTHVDLNRIDHNAKRKFPPAQTDILLVVLTETELQVALRGQPPKLLHESEVLWLPKGSEGEFRNSGRLVARFLTLEFKESCSPEGN